ncbi:MAG: glycogen synthase [Planctomycetota bacterium]
MAPIRVLHVSMECVPFSKVGGMADVVGALPAALRREGVEASVLTPWYPQIHKGEVGAELASFDVSVGDAWHPVRLLEGGPHAILVDQPTAYDRPGVYDDPVLGEGFSDSLFRCLVLQQAARVALRDGHLAADVVQCHDNHTGLLPALLMDDGGPPSVFTIHNLAYQGRYGADQFWLTGLGADRFYGHSPFEFHGDFSLMKTGIEHAGAVSTVSPSYAEEIVRPEFGYGLDGVLRLRGETLVGILNGIDEQIWDPASDWALPANFSRGRLSGKEECKTALRERVGLHQREAPLCGMVSRVTHQKGVDLVGTILPWLVRSGAQLVLLGAGNANILDLFRGAQGRWPGEVVLVEGYDEELAHLVYAGSDIFPMPSRFEPCGLTQMYAMRYGAIPVVTSMGGLKDTVLPFDDSHQSGTGVLSTWATAESFKGAMEYALSIFSRKGDLRRIRQNGMRRDFSWQRSAREYVHLYERVIGP